MARFTRKELEARNRRGEDAVIIIDNVVYDVTYFFDDHPGGPEVLMATVGRDASRCFHEVGHSDDAKRWREQFRLGEVVDEDRWEVMPSGPTAQPVEDDLTFAGFLNVWAPPLIMGALAVLAYMYLFS